MNISHRGETVLALYPTTRGIGFIVMQSPLAPIDWGTRDARGKHKNALCLKKVSALIETHQPDAIIMEDPTAEKSVRTDRIKRLCRSIASLADSQTIDMHAYSRARVQEFFESYGAKTRHEIAAIIATQVTALERFLPPRRRQWEIENPKMSIFNAAALAMTYFGMARD
jgi:hypothetical protein